MLRDLAICIMLFIVAAGAVGFLALLGFTLYWVTKLFRDILSDSRF